MPEEALSKEINEEEGQLTIADILSKKELPVYEPTKKEVEEPSKEKSEEEVGEEVSKKESVEEKEVSPDVVATTAAKEAEKEYWEKKARQLEDSKKETVDYAAEKKKINEDIALKMKALDPHDENYTEDATTIMGEQTERINEVNDKIRLQKQRENAAQLTHISTRLKEEGLLDFEKLFWELSPSVPATITGFEDSVDWGIDKIKEMKSVFTKGYTPIEEEQKETLEKEKEGFVPDAGANLETPAKKEEPEGPISVTESIRALKSHLAFKK